MNDPLIGRVLSGRFQIASFIREGGMASIYNGIQQAVPHHIALKIMHPELARDPQFVRRFRREARAAARLRHPNVVEIIEYGDDRDIVYIAMELVLGNDLVIPLERDGPFSEARAANVIVQVCDALSCAHAQNVVHRDLKPENVMLFPDAQNPTIERVKVLDFGIAKILDDQPTATVLDPNRETPSSVRSMLTRVGMIVGTPAYMSPEQGRAEPIDLRTDIYSAGVLLYELLTGVPPFTGETPMQVVMRHVNETPQPPSATIPIHSGLDALVLKALAKWPQDRFQSAGAMAAELRRMMPELATVGRSTQSSKAYAAFSPEEDAVDSVIKTAVRESVPPRTAPPSSDEDDEVATFIKPPLDEEPAPDSAPNPNPGMPTITFSLSDLSEPEDAPEAPTAKSKVAAEVVDLPKPVAPRAPPRPPAPTPVSAGALSPTAAVSPPPPMSPPTAPMPPVRPSHPPPPGSTGPAPTPRSPVPPPAALPSAPPPRPHPAPVALRTAKMPIPGHRADGNGAPAPAPASRPPPPQVEPAKPAPMKIGETLGRSWEPPRPPSIPAPSPTPTAPPSTPVDFYADPRTRRLIGLAIGLGVALLVTLVTLIGVLVALLTR